MLIDLQRNLLTLMLVAAAAVLGLMVLAMLVLGGRVNVDRIAPHGDGDIAAVEVDVPETGMAEFERYAAILERPVFFSDRRLPVIESSGEDDGLPELVELEPEQDEPVEDLKAAVAGIIITPELKMAMVRDEVADKVVILREGMSLEGDQDAWQLAEIDARQVSFSSVDGRRTSLDLRVHTKGLEVGTAPPEREHATDREQADVPQEPRGREAAAAESAADDEARARAEEIRRRVAERRAELRAEAERRRQQQQRDN